VIKLWEWQHAGATHFRAHLFNLFLKADPANLSLLCKVYPHEVLYFHRWRNSANEETFFNQFIEPETPNQKDPEWLNKSAP
jgi:hypothetical protein